MSTQTIDADGVGSFLGSRTGDAPAAPGRAEAGFNDTRAVKTKTLISAKLEVPAARERWHQETERTRLAFSKVAHRIRDEVAEDRTTVADVLLNALETAQRKERVPELLGAVEAAHRRDERARIAGAAQATLTGLHSAELNNRFAEIEVELRHFVADEIRSVLGDAVRLAPVLDGIVTAELAMKAGLTDAWLERGELAGRWMAVQRSRAWLARASNDGFEIVATTDAPDRLRRSSASSDIGIDTWRSQFDGHLTGDHETPEDVLRWFVAETNDGVEVTPLG